MRRVAVLVMTLLFGCSALVCATVAESTRSAANHVLPDRQGRSGGSVAPSLAAPVDSRSDPPGSGPLPALFGRISWREVSNWRELHDAAKK
jgi:hypothetical protein